jgi:UDP-N-acetylglucosamine 2-epimerase (non-hydrolysing)
MNGTFTIITGTRPEIIKLFPVMRLLSLKGIDYKFIHTGQHFDYELSLKFIEEFKIRKPDHNIVLKTGADSIQEQQTAEIMLKISKIFKDDFCPSIVLIQGDTNSVLASALAALKSNIPIAHLEAGLRSNDWKSFEEQNRRIVDCVADILFAPTFESANNLNIEHVHGDIHVVGNTVMDAIKLCLQSDDSGSNNNNIKNNNNNNNNNNGISDTNNIDNNNNNKNLKYFNSKLNADDFALVTLHRAENVDNRDFLKHVLTALSNSRYNYIFPMHPRTSKRIYEFGLETLITKQIKVIKPVGYFDFLRLLKMCRFVITDSGGVQEEITSPYINKHAIVLRESTERPESIQSGHAILCKAEKYQILTTIKRIETAQTAINKSPYGLGNSAEKIVAILENAILR